MSEIKKYLSKQFRVNKLKLLHNDASVFCVTCLQKKFSPIPLLCIRFVLFLASVGILTYSIVGTNRYWLIFMTNWGVVIITITSGLALAVSLKAVFKGPIDLTFGFPWYLRLYWAAYEVGICVAFFVTLFYYSFLFGLVQEMEETNHVLDLLTHGINSVEMFLLLVTAAHPSDLLHVVYPIIVLVIYVLFSVIYYYAGGLSPTGERYIYPMLDWSNPSLATAVVFGSLGVVILLQIFVVLISLLRDYLSRKYVIKKIPWSLPPDLSSEHYNF